MDELASRPDEKVVGTQTPRQIFPRRLSDDQRADLQGVLVQGWDQGLSVPELADLFEVSNSWTHQLLAEAGVTFTRRRRPQPDQAPVAVRKAIGPRFVPYTRLTEQQRVKLQKAVVEGWNRGLSVGEISDALEIDGYLVRKLLKAAGITMQWRHRSQARS